MSWNTSAYTELGTAMLTEAMSGKRMTFTRAVGGTGTLPADDLPKATSVADQHQTLILADSAVDKEGDDTVYRLKVQISNKGLVQGYTLHQIGIYAKLEGSDSDALVCIFQDEHGFEIVPEAVMSNLLLEFYGMVVISGTAQVTVTADPAAIATEAWVRKLLAEHDKDPEAHKELFAAITAENISFDGSAACLEADTVQDAVKEIVEKINGIKESLTAESIAFEDTAGTGATNLQQALDVVLGNTLPKLTVTTTAGSALTLTDGQSTITGTADSAGSFTAALPRLGEWTVTASLAGLTTDDTVTVDVVGGKYTLTLPYFAATLTVTAAPEAVVTATLPTGKAYTATADGSGSATVRIKRSGTYTVQASKGSATSDTAEAEITENGEAYAATVHFCVLTLTAPVGSALTATCGDSTMTATATGDGETGTVKLYPPALGTWSITATKDDETTTETVAATEYKNYAVELAYVRIYGVVWDKTSKTTLSRTDDAALFADPTPALGGKGGNSPFDNCLPWSGMVKETRTGGVMVKIPKFWFKWTAEGGKLKLQIADRKVAGFSVSPAHDDRGDEKGERDYVYIGRYKCASDYKSKTGASPKTNATRATFRSGIHALGSTIWQQDFAMFWTVRMLYLVEFADWDGQKVIGFNCGNNSGTQSMGTTDSMTYHTGTIQSSRSTYGVGVQYRWIEDPWGNAFEWCDGIYFIGSSVYCIKNPASFSDSSGGTKVGSRPTSGGYISDWAVPTASGFEYALYPSAVSGSETTYIADDCSYGSTGVVLDVGGYCDQSRNRGPFFLGGSCAASNSSSDIGSRLQELP